MVTDHNSEYLQPALDDYRQGVYSIPLPLGSKAPNRRGWQHLRLDESELVTAFARPCNRGRLLGVATPKGGQVVCVDLDTPEAVSLAPRLLPATQEIGGRAGAPASHWFYEVSPLPPTTRFDDSSGTRVLELLSRGAQVLVPVSLHPCGESYRWEEQGPRAAVSAERLLAACRHLAAATLLCREWPRPGSRQDLALAVAGALLRAGHPACFARRLLCAVAAAAGDEEAEKRGAAVDFTQRRLAQGEPATGWPHLASMLAPPVLQRLSQWLGGPPRSRSTVVLGSAPAADAAGDPAAGAGNRPTPLGEAAYHGLAGAIVRAIEPHTEAHPAALLFQFLTAFGNAVGHGPHFCVEATRHHANLFCVLVGASSKARKRTSWDHVLRVLGLAADYAAPAEAARLGPWLRGCIKDGLSTGEGLIWHVRDELREWRTSPRAAPREVISDPGVPDKRLFIHTGEFIAPIRCMARDGNCLSAVLRCAWDSGQLRILTRNNPVTASAAHVSILGHITAEELRLGLRDIELANGFANRFLWVFVDRSKLLPDGGTPNDRDLSPLAARLAEALAHATATATLCRSPAAQELWRTHYEDLSRPSHGLGGAVVARGEAQVVRLSLLYALLDSASVIDTDHLLAAMETWRYAGDSARYIFGGETADPLAASLLRILRESPQGLTRTEIHGRLGRHYSAARITGGLEILQRHAILEPYAEPGRGRPAQRWKLVTPDHRPPLAPSLS